MVMVSAQFWKDKNVFLTGHTGFKGAWMCLVLQKLGAHVTGYSLPAPTSPSMFELLELESALTHIEGDIRDRTFFAASVKTAQPDVIIHMAAQSLVRQSYHEPVATFDANFTGTLNLLEAARELPNLQSLLIVTTDKCYRNNDEGDAFVEDSPLGGKDPYSASKACAEIVTESYAQSFFKDSGVLVATARAGNVIGGGDWAEDRLIPDVVRAIGANRAVQIRNPLATRPWQHVLEPVYGYLALVESGLSGGWNFGPNSGSIKPVGDVLQMLQQSLEFKIELDSASHPHEAKALCLDISKAKTKLGWQPKLTLADALEWTGQWYSSYLNGAGIEAITHAQIDQYLEQS